MDLCSEIMVWFFSTKEESQLQKTWAHELKPCRNLYLLVELNERPSQLVCFPSAGPRCLAAQAVLENWLQVRRVDGLQLLPVRIAEGGGKRNKYLKGQIKS